MTVLYQGGKFDDRTLAMYREAERLTPFQFFVSQGGFNVGGVAASAGTHDRAAVDVSGSLLTPSERTEVETNLRRVGFAAWVRTPGQGFTSYHIHGVPINGDTSPAARAQVVSYLNGRNGLAGNGPDPGTRDYANVTWERYQAGSAYRPPINIPDPVNPGDSTEDDMTPEQDSRLKNIEKALQYPGGGGASWSQALANQDAANQKALLAELAAIRNQLTNIERQGQTGLGYDWLPAINDKLEALAKRIG